MNENLNILEINEADFEEKVLKDSGIIIQNIKISLV